MANEIFPVYGEKLRLALIVSGSAPAKTVTGTVAASTGLTALGDMSGVEIGSSISGTGIPTTPAPTVVAIDNAANTATMSAAGLGSHPSVPLTFTPPAGAGGLVGKAVRLYQSSLTPGKGTVLADLVGAEATFDGYSAKSTVWDTGYINGAQNAVAESALLVWVPTGGVTGNTIGGLWVDDGTGVIAIWPLPAPVAMVGPTSVLKVVLTDTYDTPGAAIQVLP